MDNKLPKLTRLQLAICCSRLVLTEGLFVGETTGQYNKVMVETVIPVEFTTPEGARTFANYLRSSVKIRAGVLYEKRVDYFKGGTEVTLSKNLSPEPNVC